MFCNKLIDSSTWRLEQIKSSFQRRFVRRFPLHCTRCTVQETEQNTWRHFHFLLQVAGHVITCTTEVSNKTQISQNHPQRFDLQSEIIIRADFRSLISVSNLPIMWLSWEHPSSEYMLLHYHSHTASNYESASLVWYSWSTNFMSGWVFQNRTPKGNYRRPNAPPVAQPTLSKHRIKA